MKTLNAFLIKFQPIASNLNPMKLKKETLWLLLAGTALMSLNLLAPDRINLSDSLTDFLKGFGLSLLIAALFVEKKRVKKHVQDL